MLYLTCSMIPRVDLAHYQASHAKGLGIWEISYKVSLVKDFLSLLVYAIILAEKKTVLIIFHFQQKTGLQIRRSNKDNSEIIFLISQRKHTL